jgi:hypothetical protein
MRVSRVNAVPVSAPLGQLVLSYLSNPFSDQLSGFFFDFILQMTAGALRLEKSFITFFFTAIG